MATFDDSKRDAADLATGMNEDTTFNTRYGVNPKKSFPMAIREIQTDAAAAIESLKTSRGFRDVGAFASGFTYELANDVAIDANGDYWAYADINALPVTVPAGTTPTEGEYSQRTWNSASAVITASGTTVQDELEKSPYSRQL